VLPFLAPLVTALAAARPRHRSVRSRCRAHCDAKKPAPLLASGVHKPSSAESPWGLGAGSAPAFAHPGGLRCAGHAQAWPMPIATGSANRNPRSPSRIPPDAR